MDQLSLSIQQAIVKRKHLRTLTNAVRAVNAKGDNLNGLIIDVYGRHGIIYIYQSALINKLDEIKAALTKAFPLDYLIVKDRTHTAASDAHLIESRVLINKSSSNTTVQEYGLTFEIDANDGLNAGLFLDMRRNRRRVALEAKERRVLNCFAYTCSFGVHAVSGKAKEVVNVDLSKTALERGKNNYRLNGFAVCDEDFVRADACAYLERAVKKDNRFDMVIIDPPAFARGEGSAFQIKKDLPKLMQQAMTILNPKGILVVTTNFNGITQKELMKMAELARGKRVIKHMESLGQDTDFPGTNTFKESYLVGIWVKLA